MDFRNVRHIFDHDTLKGIRFGMWAQHVKFGPVDSCWEWKDNPGRKYGAISIRRTESLRVETIDAHRCAWEIAHDCLLPDDVQVHHTCENKRCVNPFHLEAVTVDEHAAEHPDIAHFIERTPRTMCVEGLHELVGENVVYAKDGKRRCRTCYNDWNRAQSTFHRGDHKTECKHGHPWVPANIYTKPSTGHRECMQCHRDAEKRRRERRNAAKPG